MQEVGIEKLRYAVIVQTIQDYVASLKYLHFTQKQADEERSPGSEGDNSRL